MTTTRISGIHHITAIASDPHRTLDFYTQVISLRLVKLAGHADLLTTQRYMHLSPAATEDAIRLLHGRGCGVGLGENSGDILDTRMEWVDETAGNRP